MGGAAGFFSWPLLDFLETFPGRAEPEGPSDDSGGKVEKGTVVGSGGVGPGGGREVLLRQDGGGVKDDDSEVAASCAACVRRPCKEWRYGGRDVTMNSFRRDRNTGQVDGVEYD